MRNHGRLLKTNDNAVRLIGEYFSPSLRSPLERNVQHHESAGQKFSHLLTF